jgi:tetratricopeptide (TPR) repeat protein
MNPFIKFGICFVICVAPVYAQSDGLTAKLQRSKELMAAGKFEEAIPIYRDLVQALPNNPGPVMNLGLALHMTGREREAVSQFQAVLKLDPAHLPARLFLGAAYIGLNMPGKAVEPLNTVVRAQPDNQEARLFLGQALLSLEQSQAAAEQFERLSKLDPQNPKVWNGLGLSYESLTARNFEELEKIAPESAYWLVLVGEALSKGDQYNRAFFFYREALAKMPNMRGVHARVAEIYRRDGHTDWAAVEEEKEGKLPPLDCSGAGELALTGLSALPPNHGNKSPKLECDFWAGRYREVIASPKEAKTAEAIFWRTRAYSELARQAFDRLAQLPPSAEAHEMMAKTHFSRRNYAASTKEWQDALKFSPANPYYRQGLAISLSASGDYDGARQLLEDLVKQSPDSAELNYWLGFTLLGLENPGAAIPFLEKGVAGDPTVLPARRDLARAYLRVGQTEKAIPHLKAALPIDEGGSLYYQLAQAYRKSGQRELERETLKKFQETESSAAAEKKRFEQQIQITPP